MLANASPPLMITYLIILFIKNRWLNYTGFRGMSLFMHLEPKWTIRKEV